MPNNKWRWLLDRAHGYFDNWLYDWLSKPSTWATGVTWLLTAIYALVQKIPILYAVPLILLCGFVVGSILSLIPRSVQPKTTEHPPGDDINPAATLPPRRSIYETLDQFDNLISEGKDLIAEMQKSESDSFKSRTEDWKQRALSLLETCATTKERSGFTDFWLQHIGIEVTAYLLPVSPKNNWDMLEEIQAKINVMSTVRKRIHDDDSRESL